MAKRVFDFVFALIGLIVLSPLLILISLLILIIDGAPIFFRQKRIGKHGRPFFIWKFRTMRPSQNGPEITVEGDARITPFGSFLRRYKLDELPQLLNVLIGEMSFVGPRPEVEKYVNIFTEAQKEVLNFKPGITDYASLKFIDEADLLSKQEDPEAYYTEHVIPEKVRLNSDYQREANLFSDIFLILKTIFKIFKRV